MLPSLIAETYFATILVGLYMIMIIQTEVHKCENVEVAELKDGTCFGPSKCDLRLNCTSKNISSPRIECENPEKVTVLYLDHNKINYIQNNTFEGLSNLITLSMKNNRINKIENHTFKPLIKMKYLDLRNNLIKELEKNAFQNLTYLWRIDLENNQLTTINSGAFINCDYLCQIYLSKNHIEEIKEDSFRENSRVQHFYCSHNRITEIKFLKNFPKLRFLDLSHNNIEEIPNNILLQMKDLRTLDLSQNKLEILNSGTFSELSALENLSLSENKLKYLGEGPFDYLYKLDHLDLSNNSLGEFSYHINYEKRNNITLYVYVDNNSWHCKFIHEFKQLRWIKLRFNQINKNISNVEGIPCWDKVTYPDRSTTTTTKSQLFNLQMFSYNFTTSATLSTPGSATSTFLNVTAAIPVNNFKRPTSIKATTTPRVMMISQEKGGITEIRINMTIYIIAIFAVTVLLIIIIAVSVKLIGRNCRKGSCSNEPEFSKDGYMLPDRPPVRTSNFYVPLDVDGQNTYEEIDLSVVQEANIYEEIE